VTSDILDWTIDLPAGWFTVPVGPLDAHAEAQWADDVIARVRETAVQPGSSTVLREELRQLRAELAAQGSPWLNAAVSVRPESVMSVGCVLLTSVLGLGPGEGPDDFTAVLEEGFTRPGRGVRSHLAHVWREVAEAGELVAGFQRFEVLDLGEGLGTVEDRTIFGLFPPGSGEVLRMEFRSADLGAFDDMAEETAQFARSARVRLGTAA
jgi:hypothetical protein